MEGLLRRGRIGFPRPVNQVALRKNFVAFNDRTLVRNRECLPQQRIKQDKIKKPVNFTFLPHSFGLPVNRRATE
jgi:hypothetical protein